jgi:hypothetical protein
MPTVVRFGNVVVYMYADDHPPPHFHIVSPRTDVQVEIGTLRVIEGIFDRRDLATVVEWAKGNRALLRQKWSELNERS